MKKLIVLIALIITSFLTSCSKEPAIETLPDLSMYHPVDLASYLHVGSAVYYGQYISESYPASDHIFQVKTARDVAAFNTPQARNYVIYLSDSDYHLYLMRDLLIRPKVM